MFRYLLITIAFQTWGLSVVCGQTLAPSPLTVPGATSVVYKSIGETELRLHIFQPDADKTTQRTAIIFFFGGGWRQGSVTQFASHARHFAERGMVTVLADYRVKNRHGNSPFECVADAKSAISWLRQHAATYQVDPDRIVAAGGSAGGHIALAAALIPDTDAGKISPVPNALVLFNPVADMTEARFALDPKETATWPGTASEISPAHYIRKGLPPTLIFHGSTDVTVPLKQITKFCAAMTEEGNDCEVMIFDGRGHGFFNVGKGDGSDYRATLVRAEEFLIANGFLAK